MVAGRTSRLARLAAAALLTAGSLVATLVVSSGGAPAAAAVTCGGETPPPKANGVAWVCTFDDEFSSLLLNAHWVAQLTSNSSYTTGLSPYRVCYQKNSKTIAQSNGVLKLSVVKQAKPFTCTDPSGSFSTSYSGGMVSTYNTFSQLYGRFSVRALLPNTTVPGLQETLWLWPTNDLKYAATGPAKCEPSGEIDFAEMYSLYPNSNIPFLHYCQDANYPPNWTTNTNVYTAYPPPNNQPGMDCTMDHTQFNIYTVVWQQGQIALYVNGKTCVIDNYHAMNLASPAPFDQPFFIALTQALGIPDAKGPGNGPTASTPLPATTQIDYVRIWS